MKGCASSIVQLAIIAVPIAFFVGVWWLCDSVFGLSDPFPLIIAGASLASLFGILLWWMIAVQKKADQIIGTIEHPFFGTVNKKRASWETTMNVLNTGAKLEVSSYEGNQPTENQREIVNWLNGSSDSIMSELDDCLDAFDQDLENLPPRPRKIVIESLMLDSDEPKTCCLQFDIEDAGLPWGFSAFYVNGQIDEFIDNH